MAAVRLENNYENSCLGPGVLVLYTCNLMLFLVDYRVPSHFSASPENIHSTTACRELSLSPIQQKRDSRSYNQDLSSKHALLERRYRQDLDHRSEFLTYQALSISILQ